MKRWIVLGGMVVLWTGLSAAEPIELVWQAGVGQVTGYNVYHRDTNCTGPARLLTPKPLPPTTRTFTVDVAPGPTDPTLDCWVVTSVDPHGQETKSNLAMLTILKEGLKDLYIVSADPVKITVVPPPAP